MNFDIKFQENEVVFDTLFEKSNVSLEATFGEISRIHEIPSNYGLVTYNQNKILTVS